MESTRSVKIGLIGGMDSGKSMLAASMYHSMIHNLAGVLTVFDQTLIKDMMPSDSLISRRLQAEVALSKKSVREFAMQGIHRSVNIVSHDIKAKVPGSDKSFSIQLIDIPGSFLNGSGRHLKVIVDLLRDCDTVVVSVDTPYLMHEDKLLRGLGNKTHDVSNILKSVGAAKKGKFQVIFAPVKCERWMHEGKIDAVADAVEREYSTAISRLLQYPGTEIAVIPSETIGGIEFSEFRTACHLFSTTTHHYSLCSSLCGNLVILTDGRVVKVKDDEQIIEDGGATFAFDGHPEISRPLQWYTFAQDRVVCYRPYNCEQVMLHSIRHTFNSLLKALHRSSFAPFLPVELIGNLNPPGMNTLLRNISNLIKEASDGIRILH